MDQFATTIFPHNLNSILETAIRETSSKIDDLDVQRRLGVRCLSAAENETGWEIFVLDYNVDGPIGTVMIINSAIFVTVEPNLIRFEQFWDKHFFASLILQFIYTVSDFGTLWSKLSANIFLPVEEQENGNDTVTNLETTNHGGESVSKNARSFGCS